MLFLGWWFGGSVMQPNNNGGFLGRVFVSAEGASCRVQVTSVLLAGRQEGGVRCPLLSPPLLWLFGSLASLASFSLGKGNAIICQ